MLERKSPSLDELIARWQDLAARLGRQSVTRNEFIRESGITDHHIVKHFGGYTGLVRAAGGRPGNNVPANDEELLAEMRDAFVSVGRVATYMECRQHGIGRFSFDTYRKRWGRWQDLLIAFRRWLEHRDPSFPLLRELPNSLPATAPAPLAAGEAHSAPLSERRGPRHAKLADRPTFGNPIDFRGLRHEPVDEAGVVFLFGMVARDLGYLVERVQPGFPDCYAKREVSPNRWQAVRIELEFESRNFRDHGHPTDGCDVIVCWRHNWTECPPNLEVVELRSEIRRLSAPGEGLARQ